MRVCASFDEKIEVIDDCHLWKGVKNGYGYGKINFSRGPGGQVAAHRYAWERANGTIPKGLNVLHACNTRACVNPAHLYLGTQGDNLRDSVRAGTHPTAGKLAAHCKRGHPLSGANLKVYVDLRLRKVHRRCRTCQRTRGTQ